MRATFNDAARIEDNDLIGVCDRAETMRHDKRGAAAGSRLERRLNLGFGAGVERARSFVEDQDCGVLQNHARDADTLLLAAAEFQSALTDPRIPSLRQRSYEVEELRTARGLIEFSSEWRPVCRKRCCSGSYR